MTTDLGPWLRAQREQRGWSRSTTARRLIAAAKDAGDSAMPDVETICGYIYRWERGTTRTLTERYLLPYSRILDLQPADFGQQLRSAPDTPPLEPTGTIRLKPRVPNANPVAYRGIEETRSTKSTVRHEVLMAAHEGSDHAAHVEQHGIGDATLEQIRADLIRLSAEFCSGQPLAVFLDLRRVRERIYRVLDRRLWPKEQAELYFCLGVINGLMGVAADDLGYPESAEELIRSGWAYATAIDHRPLLATLRLQLSTMAYWRGMTLRSRDLAADGLRYLDAGPTAAHLNLKLARSCATLGDADSARRAVSAAHEARDREHHDEVLELGGEFTVSLATHHYFAGDALIEIIGAEPAATAEIEQALSLYDAGPRPGEQHGYGVKALTRIDLATVRLRSGALDAAIAALEPVLSLPPGQRITPLSNRIKLVRAELAAPIFRTSAEARSLDEQIEEFTSDSAAAGPHGLPGSG